MMTPQAKAAIPVPIGQTVPIQARLPPEPRLSSQAGEGCPYNGDGPTTGCSFDMPKKFIKRYLPSRERVNSIESLRFLGDIRNEPNLWHINRHSVARAFLIGIFLAFIPMPFQMLAAAFGALMINANLPLSVALVWISNPLTMPPLFYFNYRVGAALLDWPVTTFEFHLSWQWISERIVDIGVPLYVGSVAVATVLACLSYLLIQYLWRRKVRTDWRMRRRKL